MSYSLRGVRRALEREDANAGLLLPPLGERRGPSTVIVGYPAGRRAREIVQEAFLLPRFGLWRESLEQIAVYSSRQGSWARLVGPQEGRLHGKPMRAIYMLCALRPQAFARQASAVLLRNHLNALRLMQKRLDRDFGGPRRIRSLSAPAGDSHRGGQCVVRFALRDGRVYAYKTRSVDAEGVLFGEGWDSAAETANALLRREGVAARLPLLEVRKGSGRDGRHYGYIGWVDSSPFLKPLSRGGVILRPVRLSQATSRAVWRDAGLLAAFAYAAGVVDLHHDNLVVGRGADGGIRYHPIDAEFLGARVDDLESTLLMRGTIRHYGMNHLHAGFESEIQLCGREDESWGFIRRRGRWKFGLLRRPVPDAYPALVTDSRNRVGYRPYLMEFLSGLLSGFDAFQRHQKLLSSLLRRRMSSSRRRHIARATDVYARELQRRLVGGAREAGPRFYPSELRQMENMDVPYFFRIGGGPVQYYDPYPGRTRRAGALPRNDSMTGRRRPFPPEVFAVLLQDAIDNVVHAKAPLNLEGGGAARLQRRRGSAKTRFEGRANGRIWKVVIDSRRGTAEVDVSGGT